MKYEFILGKDFFVRTENEKVYTLLLKKTGFQIHLNQVGKYIFELLQKYQDTQSILNDLYSMFSQIDRKIIKSDFDDIFDLMLLYEVVKIEEQTNETNYSETPTIRFAGDGDYKKLTKFLKEENRHHKLSVHTFTNVEGIRPTGLRYTTFHNINYFCCAFDDSYELLGVIAIQPTAVNFTISVIDGFIFSKELKESEIIELCNKMFKVILRRFVNLTKFRINILTNSKLFLKKNFISFIEKIGFSIEAELANESGPNTLFLYSKNLS